MRKRERKPIRGGRENPKVWRRGQYDVDDPPPPVSLDGGPPSPPPVDDDGRIALALEILDSQAFCEIMKGSCHHELHVHILQETWRKYRATGGGYGNCPIRPERSPYP